MDGDVASRGTATIVVLLLLSVSSLLKATVGFDARPPGMYMSGRSTGEM